MKASTSFLESAVQRINAHLCSRDRLREAILAYTPPAAIAWLRALRGEWEYLPRGWEPNGPEADGWHGAGVAQAYRDALPAFRRAITATGPLGIPHEKLPGRELPNDDARSQNLVLAYAYSLLRAARDRERLSILDWGGGTGHYGLLSRVLLPDVDIDYHCRELPRVVAALSGCTSEITLHDSDKCLDRVYDFVVASSSLQYAEDWASLLARLGGAAEELLYVARLPVALEGESFVVRQHPTRYGYETSYVGWVLARGAFLAKAQQLGMALEREFVSDEAWTVPGAPSATESRGYLLKVNGNHVISKSARGGQSPSQRKRSP